MMSLFTRLLLASTAAAFAATFAAPAVAEKPLVTPECLLEHFIEPPVTQGITPRMMWLPDSRNFLIELDGVPVKRLSFCRNFDDFPSEAKSGSVLVRVDTETGEATLLGAARHGSLSPDGTRIAFATEGHATGEVTVADCNGAVQQRFSTPRPGSGLSWSPDGRQVAFVSFTQPEPTSQPNSLPSSIVVYPDVAVAATELEDHIHILDVETGEVREIAAVAGADDLRWSPDGARLAFTSKTWGNDTFTMRLLIARLDKSEPPRLLHEDVGAQVMAPRFTPAGDQLLFLHDSRRAFYPRNQSIVSVPIQGGPLTTLVDGRTGPKIQSTLGWSRDAKTLFIAAQAGPTSEMYALDWRGDRQMQRRFGPNGRTMSGPRLSPDEKSIAWWSEDLLGRVGLMTASFDGQNARWLFNLVPEVDELELAPAEFVRWPSSDGVEICGVLVHPLHETSDKKYPLIVDLHGGPFAGLDPKGRALLTTALEWQMWAAKGYAVLHADYRQSGSYGFDKVVGARDANEVFERDQMDILSGVDHLVAQGLVDPERVGVIGHSAGADRVNWLVTHSDRFAAAVSYEGVADQQMAYGAGVNIGGNSAVEWYNGGKPWEVPDAYRKNSAIESVSNAKTPTFFICGEHGTELLHSQYLYSALQRRGVSTQLVVYQGEAHVISRPEHLRDLLGRVDDWFDRYLQKP